MDTAEILVEKADTLIDLGRYKEGVTLLEKALMQEPHQERALILSIFANIKLKNYSRADEQCNNFIGYFPEEPAAYYYKSIILRVFKKSISAEEQIKHAISLDPYNANYFSQISAIYIDRKEWEKALEYCDEGLSIDPENIFCLNHRTLCLTQLNRFKEVESDIEDALSYDPHNDYTHSNVGWSKLQQGKIEEAKIHFKESLRLNPNSDNARVGMLESIKAQNIIYRFFLNYQFWISKHQGNIQVAVIGFVFLGQRIIYELSSKYPFLVPLYAIVIAMVYLTWIIEPFSDLFLRFNKFGKYALNKDEKRASEIVGVGLGLTFFAALYLVLIEKNYQNGNSLIWIIYFLTIIIPLSRYYLYPANKRGILLKVYTFSLTALGFVMCISNLINFPFESLFQLYSLFMLLYLIVGNYLAIKN